MTLPSQTPPTYNVITIANPVAGADFVYIVPANIRIELLFVRFQFDASIAAANRIAAIRIDDGINFYCGFTSKQDMVGGTTWYINIGAGLSDTSVATSEDIFISLTPNLIIPATHRIMSAITNIDATDQISAIRLLTKRYIA